MSATQQTRDHRRFRLAANDNETMVDTERDVDGHSLTRNDRESIATDELDTEGHRLAANDNETGVERTRRSVLDDSDELDPLRARRIRAR